MESQPFYFDLTPFLAILDKKESISLLNKTVVQTENQRYTVVRYNKNILSYDLVSSYGLCRSVILDKNEHLVCFSPPKSIPSEIFIQKYPDPNDPQHLGSIQMEELIEGTMVNVFWDPSIGVSGAWEIATRNHVGANTRFYQTNDENKPTKTFRHMFLEAMYVCQLSFDHLYKGYCYSFVLQHPENRIVVPFTKPALYLVAVYCCADYRKTPLKKDMVNRVLVYPVDIEYLKQQPYLKNSYVQYPKRYSVANYKQAIKKYASMNTPYDVLGFVIHNRMTGERCKIRNPVYEQVRQLKGNQPKLQYQYLCLRKEGRVSDYLKFYPEDKKEFSKFRDDVHLFTKTLWENYVSCFVKKEQPDIRQFPRQYQQSMILLHQHYLNELREKKQGITLTFVIDFVNEMHPSKLMFLLNFQMRKRHVDSLKEN